jgi:hypothetical protein
MRRFAFALLLLCRLGWGQVGDAPPGPDALPPIERDAKLPNGSSRNEAILKQDHARSLKDAAALAELTRSLQADLEKQGRDVLSLQTLKKLDEIEKLTHRIRARLRRY